MSKRQIELVVSFKAMYRGMDMEMLFDEEQTTVEEEVTLIIPQLEDKFVVFPKVLEGVTGQVISAHNNKVFEYLALRNKREKEAKERAKMFPFMGRTEDDDTTKEPLTEKVVEEIVMGMIESMPADTDGVETTIIYEGVEYPAGNGNGTHAEE